MSWTPDSVNALTRLTALVLLSLPSAALAQERVVPHAESRLLSGPELAELHAQLEALDGAVERLERELDDATAAGLDTAELQDRLARARADQEAFQKISQDDPAYPFLPALHEKLGELDALAADPGGLASPTIAQARQLDAFLYEDLGPGSMNYRWQTYVLSEMQQWVTNPGISHEVCAFLRDSLIEFERLGGGKASPLMMEQLAESLFRAAEPDDDAARQVVLRLHHEALGWLERLQRNDERRQYSTMFDRLFETSAEVEAVVPAASENRTAHQEGNAEDGPSGSAVRLSAREAKRRIQFHLRRFNWDPSKIAEINRLGLADYGSPGVNRDMVRILLIAYRRILQKPRHELSDRVVHIIDRSLLELARDPGRLENKEHWRLWAKAVAALRSRASATLKGLIRQRKKVEPSPHRKQALEYAWRGVHRKPRRARLSHARPVGSQPPASPRRQP